MKRQSRIVFLIAVIFAIFVTHDTALSEHSEEDLAIRAEQAGRLQEAITHYTNALQSVSEGSDEDLQIRKEIIEIVQRLDSPPEILEKAREHMARGRAAVKAAQDEQGFERAAGEFWQAIMIAPWVAEGYYNLGITFDKAGRYDEAIYHLKLYLLAAPDADDSRQVQDLIYEIGYRKEETKRAEAQEKEEQKRRILKFVSKLTGKWAEKFPSVVHYYQINPVGENGFLIEYLYSTTEFEGSADTPLKKIEVFVNGDMSLQGTATYWIDHTYIGGKKLAPKKLPMSGRVSEDGFQITLEGQWPNYTSTQWTGTYKNVVKTFEKQ